MAAKKKFSKIFVVTGPDASGKDVQIERLVNWLSKETRLKVSTVRIWDTLETFKDISDQKVLSQVIDAFLTQFTPEARSLFLSSALLNALQKKMAETELLIVNGFIYKYWASELAYGVNPSLWHQMAQCFPRPDSIFFLDVPLDVCLSRRERWTNYESGGSGVNGSQRAVFQEKVHSKFAETLKDAGHIYKINGNQEENQVFIELRRAFATKLQSAFGHSSHIFRQEDFSASL